MKIHKRLQRFVFSVRLFELFDAQKAHKLKSWQYFVFG